MYVFPTSNPYKLKCGLIFFLKLATKVLFSIYINIITQNRFGLNYIKLKRVLKPGLKLSLNKN
jgi:hypothetical protein